MGDFFTRADWRPSKKRKMQKRINHYGGRKTAPAAFLEAAKRTYFQPGRANHRICTAMLRDGSRRCSQLALDDMKVCGYHGGFGVWARKGKLQRSRTAVAREAQRTATPNPKSHPVSLELAKTAIYQSVDQWTKIKLAKAFNTPLWPNLIRQLKQRQTQTHVCD